MSAQSAICLHAFLFLFAYGACTDNYAQQPSADVAPPDSIRQETLEQVLILSYRHPQRTLQNLKEVSQGMIYSGKKNAVITLSDMPGNISEKIGRQVFASIPGAFVYDMDGSGNQINIATRGLDPHRSWEHNLRQNGVMTNSDIYGYPASHYSPPLEAIQRIELVSGAASLQYGAQFGGMVNYITKQADTSSAFRFESINTAGSFGLLSSYNAIGGRRGKFNYYGYIYRRVSEGYRENGRSTAQAQFASLGYDFAPNLSARLEFGRSQYLYQIPGPLTDAMFLENPRQSTRDRNFYSPDIYLPSIKLDWQISSSTRLKWISSAVLGARNSVQFIALADIRDTINRATLDYAPRQVDIDLFNSYTSEGTLQQDYRLGALQHTLVAGVRYINNDLHRRQQGRGTPGRDYDLSVTELPFRRDVHFRSENIAFFLENLLRISPKWQISPGVRVENGISRMRGTLAYLPGERVPTDIEHNYALLGVSTQYTSSSALQWYGSWSQAYRPVVLGDVVPANVFDVIDPDLKDAFGYNLEAGLRGKAGKRLSFDLTLFRVQYNNRIGSLLQENNTILKTNIGDSRTNGLELYASFLIADSEKGYLSVFTSTSYMDGIYQTGVLRRGNENISIRRNQIEGVSRWISRNGIQMAYKKLSGAIQYSYVSETYADAFNTSKPSANGVVGLVPAYGLWDVNAAFRVNAFLSISAGINNLTNKQYFTKRPIIYPGPGVWPSDGRGAFLTAKVTF